jgi:hypothetical protein
VVVEPRDTERIALALGSLGRMARPRHPFVPIGLHRDAAILHPRAPARVAVDAVDEVVRTGELADRFHVRVGDEAFEVAGSGSAWKAFDLHIARGIALETRVPDFESLAFEGVDIAVEGAPVVGVVEQALGGHVERGVRRQLLFPFNDN